MSTEGLTYEQRRRQKCQPGSVEADPYLCVSSHRHRDPGLAFSCGVPPLQFLCVSRFRIKFKNRRYSRIFLCLQIVKIKRRSSGGLERWNIDEDFSSVLYSFSHFLYHLQERFKVSRTVNFGVKWSLSGLAID